MLSLSVALLILGIGQAIIFVVMRLFVRRAVVGRPSFLLRAIVGLIGVVAVFLLAASFFVP